MQIPEEIVFIRVIRVLVGRYGIAQLQICKIKKKDVCMEDVIASGVFSKITHVFTRKA